jgi:hypothetical protein
MRVVLNRIFIGATLAATLLAHYWLEMAWKPAIVAGALVALAYYIAWELRAKRLRDIVAANNG